VGGVQLYGMSLETSPNAVPALDFHNANTSRSVHGLHAFAAKFPPQLAAWAIETYSQPGQTVCDPMAGSGTTLVEAGRLGRGAVGFDIDPMACLIARVKSTPLDVEALCRHNRSLLEAIDAGRRLYGTALTSGIPPDDWADTDPPPVLPGRDRWFLPSVQVALTLLKRVIRAADAPPEFRSLWYVLFSSLIVAKTSVANARDIVHSRHHSFVHARTPDVLGRFCQRLSRVERQMRAYRADGPALRPAHVQCHDSRSIPLPSSGVSLVVMSPPYCNALDYTRAHRFAVAWLADVLQVTLDDYTRLGREYIGSERGQHGRAYGPVNIAGVDSITEQVAAIDPERGRLVARYFMDMQRVLGEIGRILEPGGHAVLVVCPSHIRRIPIAWHDAFSSLGEHFPADQRLSQVALIPRTLDDHRRILPFMNAGAQLAGRMRTEYVLVLRKGGV
jgi:hypothetical protein